MYILISKFKDINDIFFLFLFLSEFFTEQVKEYARFKAFSKLMPQFSFPPEPVASGAPPAGVQSGQLHNRVPAPPASRDAAQVGDYLNHRSCQAPAVGPFRAEFDEHQ